MLANGVKETTTTTGTGTVSLSAVSGFPRFSQGLAVGQFVDYAIKSGNNWEWGFGRVAAGNTLERYRVTAKFEGGTYTKNPATGVNLSGTSEVFGTVHDSSLGVSGRADSPVVFNALHAQTSAFGGSANINFPNRLIVFPWLWPLGVDRVATGIKINVGTVGTATQVVLALIDYGAAFASSKVLASTGPIAVNTTGLKTATFSAPVYCPSPRMGIAFVANGSVTLSRAEAFIPDAAEGSGLAIWGRQLMAASSYTNPTEITDAMFLGTWSDYSDTANRVSFQLVQ